MSFYFFIILILDWSIVIIIVGDIVVLIIEILVRFLGVVNEKNLKTLTFDACYTKRKNTQYN
jgi:hypothetical protein